MNDEEMREAVDKIRSEDEMMTKLLAFLFDQITRDELRMTLIQLELYRKMLSSIILEQENHDVPLDVRKLPQLLEKGWHSFKECSKSTEETKRVVWESFMGCMREATWSAHSE